MIEHDLMLMADAIEAMEMELAALRSLDPFDPQIPVLSSHLDRALHELYASIPRGV